MQKNIPNSDTSLNYSRAEHEIYYRQLVQSLPIPVYTCNKEGYILFYNRAAATLWGREPNIGKDLWCGSWKIFDLEGLPVNLDSCPMAVALKEGKSVRGVEIIVERPDGKKVNVLPHPDLLFNDDGSIMGAVNMLVDITEHKQTKESNILLKHYNSNLEQFAYAASHDMQEPLRKIHTFSSMLLEKNADQLDEKGKNYLVKIKESAGRMNGIIQDLLDFSKETRTDDLYTETDLSQILNNILTDLELLISNKNAVIQTDVLPIIKAIPSQMNRLFYNLIQNALKFSKPGIQPLINITATNKIINKQGQAFIEISISDNGIGFENQYADKIFDLFQRLNDRKTFSGNGIGLSLCKKIVENHNGEIIADSEPEQGSSFIIHFPLEMLVDETAQ